MKASVVICSYDRADSLDRVLHHLARQTFPLAEMEIVIVDDGSIDNTPGIYLSHREKIPHLLYVATGTNKGIGTARNIGYRMCSTDNILFTDDDCVPHGNWVECMIRALESHDIVAGAMASGVASYLILSHNIAEMNAFMPGCNKGCHQFIAGANMGFQRSALEKLEGFQWGRRIAEDMELSLRARRLGYSIYFAADAVVSHEPDRRQLEILSYPMAHARETIRLRNQYRDLLGTPFVLRNAILLRLLSPVIAMKKTCEIYFGNSSNLKYLKTVPMVFLLKLIWCWGASKGLDRAE